ncbi:MULTISPECIES: hypothetical protein [Emticicia]|uniref:hypothetical protein n=1 Tax=Emticicia TaxID=312278 RepID=UPI00209C882F|nr:MULTISPECIES: hypothetical protein [Emticicia]UTA66733.1 hypothetical protein MB380_14100 [Emticicia sp. 21SJ11W-3]
MKSTASQHPQQKLWQKELELMAEDNDFMLSLLASLQAEQILTHKYDDRTSIFFNHFQYFFHQSKHLQEGLELITNEETLPESHYCRLKEEINNLIEKYEVFKGNFRGFLSSLAVRKTAVTFY